MANSRRELLISPNLYDLMGAEFTPGQDTSSREKLSLGQLVLEAFHGGKPIEQYDGVNTAFYHTDWSLDNELEVAVRSVPVRANGYEFTAIHLSSTVGMGSTEFWNLKSAPGSLVASYRNLHEEIRGKSNELDLMTPRTEDFLVHAQHLAQHLEQAINKYAARESAVKA